MKTMLKAKVLLLLGVLGVAVAAPAQVQVIYNNSTNDLHARFNPGTFEVGNEITLAGTSRNLTTFSFEYWGINTASATSFSSPIEARLRFYENNGTPFNGYATPGTSFYDSGWFSVPTPTERSTFIFTAGMDFSSYGLLIPTNDMTWTIQFQGMGQTDSVGVDLFSPPVVGQGQNFNDYWQNGAGGWTLLTNSVSPTGFGAYMEATIPEPSTVTLSIIGGLCILTLARRFRLRE
jgi:hypothetical protein